MKVVLEDVGKKYGKNWIFRHLNFQFNHGDIVAITGHNGSGKSTLLKIISSHHAQSEGKIHYSDQKNKNIKEESLPRQINFSAPYQNLIEEFTLSELLHFHFHFRKRLLSNDEIAERAGLTNAMDKPIHEFSSGMKQRLKLGLSFFTKSDLLLLDEPTSNLDENGIDWYQKEIKNINENITLIIASNQRYEYEFAKKFIDITNYSNVKSV